jgi:hypothetical protein
MNNTFAYQVLNDFNLMNKIVKQKQNICCEIGKKILTNFDYYHKQRSELVVNCIEEYFKKEVSPKIRALNWKNIWVIKLFCDEDYSDSCFILDDYDERNYAFEYGFDDYNQYKEWIDSIICEMKKDIDNDDFVLPNVCKFAHWRKTDPERWGRFCDLKETQIKIYKQFKTYEFKFNINIYITKKGRPLKAVSRQIIIDLD